MNIFIFSGVIVLGIIAFAAVCCTIAYGITQALRIVFPDPEPQVSYPVTPYPESLTAEEVADLRLRVAEQNWQQAMVSPAGTYTSRELQDLWTEVRDARKYVVEQVQP